MSSIDENNYCQHCYPYKNRHVEKKFESLVSFYVSDPLDYLLTLFFLRKAIRLISQGFQRIVLNFSQIINHSKRIENVDRSQLGNEILVIFDEAKKRNLKIFNIQFGDHHTQHFMLLLNGKKYYFDRNPIYLVTKKQRYYNDPRKYDNKSFFKKILLKNDIPCPKGKSFISEDKALSYGIQLGFPLVVKPAFSSFSQHVSVNIKSQKELRDAIMIAKQVNYSIVVEQYIPGDVHRITIIDNQIIACAKRQIGRIVGDGKASIEKLINEKNSHPWRGELGQLNYTLFKTEKNKHLKKILVKQSVNLKTKLKKGQIILLSNKMNSGNGADVTNVTALIHPENAALFLKIQKILNLPLVGLDFICQDVSIPWKEQPFAIIENNSLPHLDIHHYPSMGEPINVAGKIWDFVLESLTPSDPCCK